MKVCGTTERMNFEANLLQSFQLLLEKDQTFSGQTLAYTVGSGNFKVYLMMCDLFRWRDEPRKNAKKPFRKGIKVNAPTFK